MVCVAVVDDDVTFVDLVVEVLGMEGYDVLTYYQSDGTFALLRDAQPDLIILDVRLEHRDSGWQLLELIRLDPVTAGIPLIACSADAAQLSARKQWLDEQGILTLFKPFDLDELLDLIALRC